MQDRQNNTATSPQENNYGGLGGLGEKNTTLSLSTTENRNTAKNANIPQLADSGDVEQERQNNTATSPQENNYGGLGGLGEKSTTLSLSTTENRNTAKNANIPQLGEFWRGCKRCR